MEMGIEMGEVESQRVDVCIRTKFHLCTCELSHSIRYDHGNWGNACFTEMFRRKRIGTRLVGLVGWASDS